MTNLSALSLFMAMLHYMHHCCSADGGSIDIAPVTQYANLSNYATFYCRATGRNTRWGIRNVVYNSDNRTEDGYMFSELTEWLADGNIVHDMYLSIRASPENNETAVVCTVFVNSATFSAPVKLIVQGGPAAPDVEVRMINPGLIVLQWDTPFTWNHTTIEHYKITSNNPLWDDPRYDSYTENALELTGPTAECAEYTFTVLANNGVADGDATTVTGGFPIIPHLFLDTITVVVAFTANLLPITHLTIKLPRVCEYQMLRWYVTIRNESERVFEEGPYDQAYLQGATVEVSTHELTRAGLYYAEVTFDVLGIEEDSDEYHLTAYSPISASLKPIITAPTADLTTESGKDTHVILIAAVSAASCLLVMGITVMGVAAVYFYKRQTMFRSGTTERHHPNPMVTNPIYDGQSIYETIADAARVKPITLISGAAIPPPTPNSERPLFAVSASTPNSAQPLLYPPIDPAYVYPPQQPFTFPPTCVDDGYTRMALVEGVGKAAIAGTEESRSVKEVPEDARYVTTEPSKRV